MIWRIALIERFAKTPQKPGRFTQHGPSPAPLRAAGAVLFEQMPGSCHLHPEWRNPTGPHCRILDTHHLAGLDELRAGLFLVPGPRRKAPFHNPNGCPAKPW